MLASQRSRQSQEDTPMNEAPHYQESTENKALAAAIMGEGTRTKATGKLGHLLNAAGNPKRAGDTPMNDYQE